MSKPYVPYGTKRYRDREIIPKIIQHFIRKMYTIIFTIYYILFWVTHMHDTNNSSLTEKQAQKDNNRIKHVRSGKMFQLSEFRDR